MFSLFISFDFKKKKKKRRTSKRVNVPNPVGDHLIFDIIVTLYAKCSIYFLTLLVVLIFLHYFFFLYNVTLIN